MDVREAVASRFSCRAFLPAPVPLKTVRAIIDRASRAPSGGNLQPWRVHVLAGAPLEALKARIRPHAPENPRGEGCEYQIYPQPLKEPYDRRRREVGAQLHAAIGIAREDRPARYRQYARNFELFGAPVGLFFSIDRSLGPPQWADLGMFVQTIMLLARAEDLHTCAMEAWTFWHRTVAACLALPPELMVFCAMGLGHADPAAPANRWRSPREDVDSFADFSGFAGP
ncbi:MAG: nitroreductase [Bradyrhizobiaceae bacterium]|nr:nitroreductase [Bradyrhizobiaceae bacterium]